MTLSQGGLSEEAWKLGFEGVRFPAMVVDRELKVRTSNPSGEEWLSRTGGLDALGRERLLASYPTSPGSIATVPARSPLEGAAMMGLREEWAVLCIGDDVRSASEYLRLFDAYNQTMETAQKRHDRLEVYHELLTHDAPNFITAVYGYLQMIQAQELPPEKLHKYIDASIKQTEALNHLIDTARTLRQLETTPLGPTSPRDLRTMVEESIPFILESYRDKSADILDRIPPGSYQVRAEEGLAEVFRIILSNGVRYSDRPVVCIDLADEEGFWHLRFTDNGRGIPDEKKDFVFLRFDRLDKQRKIRGSGLGLALARALVERHGGRIWVDNRVPGDHTKGSVFHVLLPKA